MDRFSSWLSVLLDVLGGGDVLQLKARPWRELAEEYLLESTKFWSESRGGAEEGGGGGQRDKEKMSGRDINE